jgi:hypothetical protein
MTNRRRKRSGGRNLTVYEAQDYWYLTQISVHITLVHVNTHLLARQTRLPGATDNTRYGEGRASPRSFLTHHVANISTAIQTPDAQTIHNAASARMLRVSFGVM